MHIANKTVEKYGTTLVEKYRPPSLGGNTRAWHSHRMLIEGAWYSFLAVGAKRWVFKGDSVSFEFNVADGWNNVDSGTLVTIDGKGKHVLRGDRSVKKQWRSSEARLPSSRREQHD